MKKPYRVIAVPPADEFLKSEPPYREMLPADGRVLQHMEENCRVLRDLLLSLPEQRLSFRYAPEKWDIREVVIHLMDNERVFAYRALRFARGETENLRGYDHLAFVAHSGVAHRGIDDLMDEYEAVRNATIALFNGLPDEALLRWGVANGRRATVRALAFHIAGHELHHMDILRQRYLV
jgi:hypothetical protein